jgi:hypothetical protein
LSWLAEVVAVRITAAEAALVACLLLRATLSQWVLQSLLRLALARRQEPLKELVIQVAILYLEISLLLAVVVALWAAVLVEQLLLAVLEVAAALLAQL